MVHGDIKIKLGDAFKEMKYHSACTVSAQSKASTVPEACASMYRSAV